MTESVDGHRWPQRATSPICSCGKPVPEDGGKEGVCECCSTCSPDVPPSVPAVVDAPRPIETTPQTPVTPDQQSGGVALPACDAHPGYVMRLDTVALHFPIDAVPALAELFPQHADALHAAALDVEMEAESQQDAAGAWRFA